MYDSIILKAERALKRNLPLINYLMGRIFISAVRISISYGIWWFIRLNSESIAIPNYTRPYLTYFQYGLLVYFTLEIIDLTAGTWQALFVREG
jgi:hypothetical protein